MTNDENTRARARDRSRTYKFLAVNLSFQIISSFFLQFFNPVSPQNTQYKIKLIIIPRRIQPDQTMISRGDPRVSDDFACSILCVRIAIDYRVHARAILVNEIHTSIKTNRHLYMCN